MDGLLDFDDGVEVVPFLVGWKCRFDDGGAWLDSVGGLLLFPDVDGLLKVLVPV